MRFTTLLRHGVYAGAAAGLCAAVVLLLVVEPVIERAIAVEEGRAGHGHDEPLVSRLGQVIGGAVTAALVGVLVGVVFAVVFARARHRLWARTELGSALALAGLGFVVVTLLPALEAPADPPGVGDPGTVSERTLLFVLTILLGLLVVGLVLLVDGRLLARGVPVPLRTAAGVVVGVVGAAAVLLLVPDVDVPVPADVPPSLLWDFRVASLAQLGTLWLVLGLVFGVLADPRTRAARRPVATSA